MIRIYICPECYNFRMVSRKPDAVCYHCGSALKKCEDLEYVEYMNMTEEERNIFKEKYKNRIMRYQDKMNALIIKQLPNKDREPLL